MNILEAYDTVLNQIAHVIEMMTANQATMEGASPAIRAECIALQSDMYATVQRLESIANRLLEAEGRLG